MAADRDSVQRLDQTRVPHVFRAGTATDYSTHRRVPGARLSVSDHATGDRAGSARLHLLSQRLCRHRHLLDLSGEVKSEYARLVPSTYSAAARPKETLDKATCPVMSRFANYLTCALPIMFIVLILRTGTPR